MLPNNFNEPMGAEKQIEIKLLHPASTEGVTDSGLSKRTDLCTSGGPLRYG
ncbi:MAG: hypothetical protein P8X89_22870 [Reinekea sp.]